MHVVKNIMDDPVLTDFYQGATEKTKCEITNALVGGEQRGYIISVWKANKTIGGKHGVTFVEIGEQFIIHFHNSYQEAVRHYQKIVAAYCLLPE